MMGDIKAIKTSFWINVLFEDVFVIEGLGENSFGIIKHKTLRCTRKYVLHFSQNRFWCLSHHILLSNGNFYNKRIFLFLLTLISAFVYKIKILFGWFQMKNTSAWYSYPMATFIINASSILANLDNCICLQNKNSVRLVSNEEV